MASRFLVHSIANSRSNDVKVVSENVLKVKVAAPPIDGQAEDKLIEILAKHFGVHKNNVSILKKIAARQHIVSIEYGDVQ